MLTTLLLVIGCFLNLSVCLIGVVDSVRCSVMTCARCSIMSGARSGDRSSARIVGEAVTGAAA